MNSIVKINLSFLVIMLVCRIGFCQSKGIDVDSLVRTNLKVFKEVVNNNKDINSLREDQIIVWHTLSIITSTATGKLNYLGVDQFEYKDLKKWEEWYAQPPNTVEFIKIFETLNKIYSGDYSQEHLDFIDEVSKKNRNPSSCSDLHK